MCAHETGHEIECSQVSKTNGAILNAFKMNGIDGFNDLMFQSLVNSITKIECVEEAVVFP